MSGTSNADKDKKPKDRKDDMNEVDEASDESFPASDPPAWIQDTGTGAPSHDDKKKDKA